MPNDKGVTEEYPDQTSQYSSKATKVKRDKPAPDMKHNAKQVVNHGPAAGVDLHGSNDGTEDSAA